MTPPTLSERIGRGTPPQIGEVPQRGGGVRITINQTAVVGLCPYKPICSNSSSPLRPVGPPPLSGEEFQRSQEWVIFYIIAKKSVPGTPFRALGNFRLSAQTISSERSDVSFRALSPLRVRAWK